MKARLPLNNLNTFAAAVECVSFQVAADRLHVTPSAVSHQVRNLEGLLGYPLFERLDKRVRLTTRGQRLFTDIREPLRQLHAASAKALRGQDGNMLALSVAPFFATRWLMPRLKDFHRAYPEINLSVIATTDIVDFRSDGIDASIRLGRGEWTDTDAALLFHAKTAAVCSPHLVEAHGGLFEVEDLRTQTLVVNSSLPGLWADWFQSAGVRAANRQPERQVQSSAQILEALQSDDCVGLVDLNLVSPDVDAGRVALACAHIYDAGDGYYLTFPTGAEPTPALEAFRQWLFDQVSVDA